LELVHMAVSENLLPFLNANVKAISAPFEVPFDASGNFGNFELPAELPEEAGDFEEASRDAESVRA
jgi:hypothetical protein